MENKYNLVFPVLFLICFSISISGQNFNAGMDAGLTGTLISGDRDPDGGRPRLGVYTSIFTNYPVSEYSYWQLELMYIQKGSRAYVSGNEPDEEYRDYRLDLHYVEIPIIYKYTLSPTSRIRTKEGVTLETGISFGRVIGHREMNEGLDITDSVAEQRPFNYGDFNIIAGLYYPLTDNFDFHFRFSQGFTPVRPHRDDDLRYTSGSLSNWVNQFGQYNTAFSFGLSYHIL